MHYRVMDSDLCVSKTLELDALSFCFKRNCQLENIYYNLLHIYNIMFMFHLLNIFNSYIYCRWCLVYINNA